ncbi:response regulator [uncultured Winogradskyella sp.]|uniref:PAS domain-containing hybrid sensor histidine kinase/response regulator n=1 Tax=uncultured Winogradskyella sp. TaxID=395353 RepID=UPI0026079F2D|nr:response regulator [uncultured Winogradskyella sp.]|tara:strand:- start:3992 stop:5722 length:1731 start_codon:yes stop_codon:yes gene_type:complete
MLETKKHRLLRRQIRNAGFTDAELEKFQGFFNVVNQAYEDFDEDIKHVENILEKSSNELYKANKALKSEIVNVESKLNTIVNNIEGVIFKTDFNGDFKYLNHAFEEMFGLSIKDSLNKNYKDFFKGINKYQEQKITKVLHESKHDFNTIFEFVKPTGEKIWVELRLVPTYCIQGMADGAIGTLMDITKLKETEIELKQANKTKDEFLSTMSHEIRTPLNAVIGMSDILLMEDFLPSQLENLEVLKYSSEHLLGLINDLLNLNKYKSEEIEIKEKDFNFIELIQNIKHHFKQTTLSKNLSFNVEIESAIPVMLIGDQLKLSQVLKNLLSNAIKFTHKGGIVFRIEKVKSLNDTTVVRFNIIDTGIGVSYDKQKDIFKSFVQANENTTALYGGSGLGLYISKQLLKIQNSELQLESKIGAGSKFWFEIEFRHSKMLTTEIAHSSAKTQPINLRVLLAEDNTINILVMTKLLRRWKVEYEIAKNGQEVLDIYAKKDFDIILMDLQMPVLDGYDTAKIIRKMDDTSKSTIPIVPLTAFSEVEVREKTERYKMNGYLSKPFDVNELHELLKFYSHKSQYAI